MTVARITKTVTLSVPPEMDRKINALMKKEGRTRSEP
jgi:predicted DNA-binding protein